MCSRVCWGGSSALVSVLSIWVHRIVATTLSKPASSHLPLPVCLALTDADDAKECRVAVTRFSRRHTFRNLIPVLPALKWAFITYTLVHPSRSHPHSFLASIHTAPTDTHAQCSELVPVLRPRRPAASPRYVLSLARKPRLNVRRGKPERSPSRSRPSSLSGLPPAYRYAASPMRRGRRLARARATSATETSLSSLP